MHFKRTKPAEQILQNFFERALCIVCVIHRINSNSGVMMFGSMNFSFSCDVFTFFCLGNQFKTLAIFISINRNCCTRYLSSFCYDLESVREFLSDCLCVCGLEVSIVLNVDTSNWQYGWKVRKYLRLVFRFHLIFENQHISSLIQSNIAHSFGPMPLKSRGYRVC